MSSRYWLCKGKSLDWSVNFFRGGTWKHFLEESKHVPEWQVRRDLEKYQGLGGESVLVERSPFLWSQWMGALDPRKLFDQTLVEPRGSWWHSW